MQEPNGTASARPRRKLEKIPGAPSIYRDGRTFAVIVKVNGKTVRRHAKTLAEAKRLKAALVTDGVRGEFRPRSRLTLEEYGREWIERYEGRTDGGVRPATLAGYREMLERDAYPALGRVRLVDVDLRMLKRYASDLGKGERKGKTKDGRSLRGRPLSRSSVRLALAPVKAMLADAHEEGLLRGNPASGLRIVGATRARGRRKAELVRDRKALSEAELGALLAELPERWRLFVEFMAHTGLRLGEASGLRWKHVDLSGRRVEVRERVYRGEWDAPKSEFGVRDVPITVAMAEALGARWREERPASGEALVFGSARGTPLDASALRGRVLKPAARRAGVPWASFHTLRHTCATMLRREGWSAEQVQLFLGHHAPSFTSDVYVHLDADDLPAPDFLDGVTRVNTCVSRPGEIGGDRAKR